MADMTINDRDVVAIIQKRLVDLSTALSQTPPLSVKVDECIAYLDDIQTVFRYLETMQLEAVQRGLAQKQMAHQLQQPKAPAANGNGSEATN